MDTAEPYLVGTTGDAPVSIPPHFLAVMASANPRLWQQVYPDTPLPAVTAGLPACKPIVHVLPLFFRELDTGVLMPLEFTPSRSWHLSDAFGRFFEGRRGGVWESFEYLMRLVQKCFEMCLQSAPPEPMLLRHAFNIQLGCPVHLERIAGASLTLPLLAALLREMARDPVSGELPFGAIPVFCTGAVNSGGRIESVNNGIEKALGFLREYGEGCSAILPVSVIGEICAAGLNKCFSDIHPMETLADFLRAIPGLEQRLTAPPCPAEMDGLLNTLASQRALLNFSTAHSLQRWLSRFPIRPYYRSGVLLAEAQLAASEGFPTKAAGALETARTIMNKAQDCSVAGAKCCRIPYGTDSQLRVATRFAANACYLMACDQAVSCLREVEGVAGLGSPAARAHYWGAYSRAHRLMGCPEEAVSCAEQAVACAQCGAVSWEAHYRNYLVHALLALGAAAREEARPAILDLVREHLKVSETAGSTGLTGREKENNHFFCCWLTAAAARLEKIPYTAPLVGDAAYFQVYGYLWLNCARNTANTRENRITSVQQLLRCHAERPPTARDDNLWCLFEDIYRLYAAALLEESSARISAIAARLQQRVQVFKRSGWPGWWQTLTPHLDAIRSRGNPQDIETLCDAVPFF